MDALQEKELVAFSRSAKLLYLTKEGEQKAQEAITKLEQAFAS